MTALGVAPDVAVTDEAEYAALALEDAEAVSTDAFGCGCIPVLRGDGAKVPHPRPPGYFPAAEGVPAPVGAPPPHNPVQLISDIQLTSAAGRSLRS